MKLLPFQQLVAGVYGDDDAGLLQPRRLRAEVVAEPFKVVGPRMCKAQSGEGEGSLVLRRSVMSLQRDLQAHGLPKRRPINYGSMNLQKPSTCQAQLPVPCGGRVLFHTP